MCPSDGPGLLPRRLLHLGAAEALPPTKTQEVPLADHVVQRPGPSGKSYHSFQGVEVKLVDVPLRPLQPETPHRLVQQQVDWALLERASQGMEVQHEHLQDDLHLHRQEREKAMARLEAFEANTAYTSVLILNGLTLILGLWPVSCSWRGPGFCVLGLMDVDWRRC